MLHGIFDVSPYKSDFLVNLETVRTGYGEGLPPRQHDEIRREIVRLRLVQGQIAELEVQKKELVAMGKADLEQAAPRAPSTMAAVATEAAAAAERPDQAVAEVLEQDGGQEPNKDGSGTCSGDHSTGATLTSLKGIGEDGAILRGSDVFPKAVDSVVAPLNPVVSEGPGPDGDQKSIEDRPGNSGCGAIARMAATLTSLKGIGENDAILLSCEVFSRDFANRRQIGSWAGLTSVPWQSGGVDHEQGISKAGTRAQAPDPDVLALVAVSARQRPHALVSKPDGRWCYGWRAGEEAGEKAEHCGPRPQVADCAMALCNPGPGPRWRDRVLSRRGEETTETQSFSSARRGHGKTGQGV